MEQIIEVAGNFGVAVAMCFAMGLFIYKISMKWMDDAKERETKLRELIIESHDLTRELSATNEQFVRVLEGYNSDLKEIKEDIEDIKSDLRVRRPNEEDYVYVNAEEKKR